MPTPRHRPIVDRFALLRRGVVLAFLALVFQTVGSVLPMSAEAEGLAGTDARIICSINPDGTHRDKTASHGVTVCPVCQAAHLGLTLLPPAPIGLAEIEDGPRWRTVRTPDLVLSVVRFERRQARAPPAI